MAIFHPCPLKEKGQSGISHIKSFDGFTQANERARIKTKFGEKTLKHYLLASMILGAAGAGAYTDTEIQSALVEDAPLSQMDHDLNVLYQTLKDFSFPHEKEELIQEQRAWSQERQTTASTQDLKEHYEKRLQVLKNRLGEKEDPIMGQIITTHDTIDKEKALELLQKCPTLNCQAYALYFTAHKKPTAQKRQASLEKGLLALLDKMDPARARHTNLDQTRTGDALFEILSFSDRFLPGDVEEYPSLNVPLWMVLEHPQILSYDSGTSYAPYTVHVMAQDEVTKSPHYEAFNEHLNDLFVGRWNSGTLYRTFYSTQRRMLDFLSFAPKEGFTLSEDEKPATNFTLKNTALERWSFLGPWNLGQFEAFKKSFAQMAQDLRAYYATHDYLNQYAPMATNYLNAYVDFNYGADVPMASPKAYDVFHGPHQPLSLLEKQTKSFSKQDWNAALSYAILNNYDTKILDWIIASGADIRDSVDGETPLIKASNRPEALSFLIKKGALLEGKTPFGKTALFYAVQFNNQESVKILVEAGARINAVLQVPEDDQSWQYEDLQQVRGFTPLAYSIRYGNLRLTQYLISKGGNFQGIDMDILRDWVKDLKRYGSQMALTAPSS